MTKKGHKFSEEHNKNLSKSLKRAWIKRKEKFGPSGGVIGNYKKEHIPWNKGKKGQYHFSNKTQFKKGQSPWNKGLGKPEIKNICKNCGNIFISKYKSEEQKFCSHSCHMASTWKDPILTIKRSEKISKALIGRKLSEKHRQKILGNKNRLGYPCSYSYYSGYGRGRRKDLNNQYFRSKWEANFARILNYWKIPWEYEKTRFNLGDCTYCPDFKIYDVEPYFVEVVGFFDDIHKNKLSLFQKMYPNEKIQIISSAEYKDLKDKFSTTIKNWEK